MVTNIKIFYRRHSDLIIEYNVRLKTLLQQAYQSQYFITNLVHKLKKNNWKAFFFIS